MVALWIIVQLYSLLESYGEVFKAIFHFTPSSYSTVTSDPLGVCICDPHTGEPNCTVKELSLGERYPGERFKINVTAVGQTNGTIPALINVTDSSSNVSVISHGYNPPIMATCQSITVAVYSPGNTTTTFNMSVIHTNPAKQHFNYHNNPDIRVAVNIIDCSWIFQLNKASNSCECNNIFKPSARTSSCDITNMSIAKKDWVWVNCTVNKKKTSTITLRKTVCSKIELSTNCRYCEEAIFIPSNLSNNQCIEGRYGRLCAGCKPDYSVSLGIPKCLHTAEQCSVWMTFVLIIVFAVAGILLICVLTASV